MVRAVVLDLGRLVPLVSLVLLAPAVCSCGVRKGAPDWIGSDAAVVRCTVLGPQPLAPAPVRRAPQPSATDRAVRADDGSHRPRRARLRARPSRLRDLAGARRRRPRAAATAIASSTTRSELPKRPRASSAAASAPTPTPSTPRDGPGLHRPADPPRLRARARAGRAARRAPAPVRGQARDHRGPPHALAAVGSHRPSWSLRGALRAADGPPHRRLRSVPSRAPAAPATGDQADRRAARGRARGRGGSPGRRPRRCSWSARSTTSWSSITSPTRTGTPPASIATPPSNSPRCSGTSRTPSWPSIARPSSPRASAER